jgi:phenylacetate-coenzyme A ligase PaaK-like adenylate-forming protein
MNDESRMLSVSRGEIEGHQLARLRETLERIKRAPYFGERFADSTVESLSDVAALPLTTKDDLRAASPFGGLAVPMSELIQYHESTGTTGVAASSWLTRNDCEAFADQINQCALDFNPEDVLVNKFPYAISMPAHIVKHAAQKRGACVVSASSLSPLCTYTRTLELMQKTRATVLTCLPTDANLLAAAAMVMGLDPAKDFHLRAIGTAGALLTDARRRRISECWDCDVFNYYGTTETGNLAADCSEGKLHLAWDHFLFEVLDPVTQQRVPEGEAGMPAITTLLREAMPLVRYVLSDSVRLVYDHNCSCGRRSPIVDHHGRDQNRFEFQDRSISMADIEDRMFRLPSTAVGDIWMIVVTPERVYFRTEAVAPAAAVYRQAEQHVQEEFDLPLTIDAVPPGALFPIEMLMEPAFKGKPSYYCHAASLDEAPRNLPELWAGAFLAGMEGPPGTPPPGSPAEG